jgi:hypothetical protein
METVRRLRDRSGRLHRGQRAKLADGEIARETPAHDRPHKKYFGQAKDIKISLDYQFGR